MAQGSARESLPVAESHALRRQSCDAAMDRSTYLARGDRLVALEHPIRDGDVPPLVGQPS